MPASCAKAPIREQSILAARGDDTLRFPASAPSVQPTRGTVHPITLDYGADQPLVFESPAVTPGSFAPPAGATGAEARGMVAAALTGPLDGPPLTAHVVPGDRVVIAIAGEVPQEQAVVEAVRDCLMTAGVEAADVAVLEGPMLGYGSSGTAGPRRPVAGAEAFDPAVESATAYLAADEAGRPLHLARALVDADVVVAVGEWGWSPAFGGRSIEGELWPTFARAQCRRDLLVALARRGRNALAEWKGGMQDIAWQLGVCASLRVVRGAEKSILAARFGLPDEAARQAREVAAAWCPQLEQADVVVAALSDPDGGFGMIAAAASAAARATRPGGMICVACRHVEPPGVILTRWRQGAPLEPLVHEAVASGDESLIADALLTRIFARGLADRRLVLLSDLDEAAVEELEFGHAPGPESVQRLARRSDRLAVVAEADRSFPHAADRISEGG